MGLFLIKGILIGLLFGMPAGAVGAMTAQRTLNYGLKAGLLTGLGSSVADCLYACVGAFGLTFISDFLLQYQSIIHLAGGFLILGMGIRMLQMKNNKTKNITDSTGRIRMFVSSFAVGITNPAAILTFLFAFSWFGIGEKTGLTEGIVLVCGVFIGTYIWWGTLSGAVTLLKKKAKENHLRRMNQLFGMILILFGTVVFSTMILSACRNETDSGEVKSQTVREASEEITQSSEVSDIDTETGDEQMQKMIMEVGGQSFQATLYDNGTVRALMELLPMTLNMEELHGNEKFYYLEEGLPTNSENIGNIQTGDIMLFGSDCLVLFFEDFSTSYNYTRIGQIENPQEFAETLASGTVEVSFYAGE